MDRGAVGHHRRRPLRRTDDRRAAAPPGSNTAELGRPGAGRRTRGVRHLAAGAGHRSPGRPPRDQAPGADLALTVRGDARRLRAEPGGLAAVRRAGAARLGDPDPARGGAGGRASSAYARCATPRRPTGSCSAAGWTPSSRRSPSTGSGTPRSTGWPGHPHDDSLEAVVVHSDLPAPAPSSAPTRCSPSCTATWSGGCGGTSSTSPRTARSATSGSAGPATSRCSRRRRRTSTTCRRSSRTGWSTSTSSSSTPTGWCRSWCPTCSSGCRPRPGCRRWTRPRCGAMRRCGCRGRCTRRTATRRCSSGSTTRCARTCVGWRRRCRRTGSGTRGSSSATGSIRTRRRTSRGRPRPGVSQRTPSSRKVRRVASGSSRPPSTSVGVGTARSEVPTSNSMPTKVASSGTGAAPVLVSGPVRHACVLPSRSKNTNPQLTAATAVISATCSLVQVHTVSIQGESDPRVSNCSCPTEEGYARPAGFVISQGSRRTTPARACARRPRRRAPGPGRRRWRTVRRPAGAPPP